MYKDVRYSAWSQDGGAVMYKDVRYSAWSQDGGAVMYRMYGQIFAPAISALPPSVVVVCRKKPGMAVRRI